MNLEPVLQSEASQNIESRKMVLMNLFAGPEWGTDIENGLLDTEGEWVGDELREIAKVARKVAGSHAEMIPQIFRLF